MNTSVIKQFAILSVIASAAAFSALSAAHGRPPMYRPEKTELLFFCGSAVKVPMEEIIAAYEKKTGVKVNVTYGGSGTLLSRMELAGRGDVYLSGSPDYVEIGERKKLLAPGTARKINYLVPAIIVPKNNPKNVRTLKDLARKDVAVGMGNPETVCLGLYGVELLDSNGLLENVLPNVRVYAKSCEDTAMLAALGKVDAIIGWDVFESWNPRDVEWIKIPPAEIPRLAYAAAALPVYARDPAASADFIDYMTSREAANVWKKWGYISDEKEARRHAPGAAIGGEYKIPGKYRNLLKKIHRVK